MRPTGLEPVTPGLGIPCSILLSYGRSRGRLYGRAVRPGKATAERRALLAGLLALLGTAPALGEPAAGVRVAGPRMLQLEDGRTVLLAGVVVPGELWPAPGGPERVAAAAALLAERLAAGDPELEPLAGDRYGRILALARAADGGLLQEALVEAGLAYAFPDGLPQATARALLAAEARARAAGRGLWAVPDLAEQPAARVAAEPPRFAVVTGRIVAVGRSEAFTWLNFGADRRQDLTVRIPAAALRAVRRGGLDPARLEGRRVRVRGWLFAAGGAMIEVDDALQLEVLE